MKLSTRASSSFLYVCSLERNAGKVYAFRRAFWVRMRISAERQQRGRIKSDGGEIENSRKVTVPQVRKHNRSARIVAEQLRFNHQVCFKTHHEKSVVIMMGIVLGVFLVCYGMYLRCSFLLLFQPTITSSPCSDKMYKIPVVVLNWAINPLAYVFFKRA